MPGRGRSEAARSAPAAPGSRRLASTRDPSGRAPLRGLAPPRADRVSRLPGRPHPVRERIGTLTLAGRRGGQRAQRVRRRMPGPRGGMRPGPSCPLRVGRGAEHRLAGGGRDRHPDVCGRCAAGHHPFRAPGHNAPRRLSSCRDSAQRPLPGWTLAGRRGPSCQQSIPERHRLPAAPTPDPPPRADSTPETLMDRSPGMNLSGAVTRMRQGHPAYILKHTRSFSPCNEIHPCV